MTKLVTKNFKTHFVNQLVESVQESSNTIYYMFAGKHREHELGDSNIPTPNDSVKSSTTDVYQDMIFGKKVVNDAGAYNVLPMVQRNTWTSGTIYSRYDHEDVDLYNKKFFVVVGGSGEDRHVFKCLNNANGNPSVSEPNYYDAGGNTETGLYESNDDYYETEDGYHWKYMYSVESVIFERFATQKYIPVIENSSVKDTAVDGSIDVVKINSHGTGYNNYFEGTITAVTQIEGSQVLLATIPDSTFIPNDQTNFYSNTIMYMTSGNASGAYRRITSSIVTTSGVKVTLEAPFSTTPEIYSTYTINPEVKLYGASEETIQAVAYAVINSNSTNSVHKVEMLNPGRNYNYATAQVLIGSTPPTGNASLVPIISPAGGHGYNAVEELGSTAVGFSVEFKNSEEGLLPMENEYRQVGLLRDPKFNDIEIGYVKPDNLELTGSNGTFLSNEFIYQIKSQRLFGDVEVTSGNNTVVAQSSDADYSPLLTAGDVIYLQSSGGDDNIIANVVSVFAGNTEANSTVTIDVTPTWSDAATKIHASRIIAKGVAGTTPISDNIGYFVINKLEGVMKKNELIIGGTSYSTAIITDIDRTGPENKYSNNYTFSTFDQRARLYIESSVADFIVDETVRQIDGSGNVTGSAIIHSKDTVNNILYCTNVLGDFIAGQRVYGLESGVSPNLIHKYAGDLDPNSGRILFIQNSVPVTREGTYSEQIKIVLEF